MSKKNKESLTRGQISKNSDYLWSMSLAPKIDQSTHWIQMLPAAFFTAAVILLTRMHSYTRPMEQFFWSGGQNQLSDFFSYFKMVGICIASALALVLLLYRVFCQAFFIKKSFAYIPMVIYSILVLLSYAFSEYKEFAWIGWNDRFEGTIVLLAYMLMLFFIISSVNSEKDIKWIVYPITISSLLLSLLGISQALDKDFFRTTIGQKLLVPNYMTEGGSAWSLIDKAAEKGEQFLQFTFQNKQIYQTVYNINYVSFYLTLLIPLFGMLFIKSIVKGKESPIWQKILWGIMFGLVVFNLIGSASSGGLMGMAVVVLVAIIMLNKRILLWWKPVVILVIITLLVTGTTSDRWMPEFFGAVNSAMGKEVFVLDKDKVNTKKITSTEGAISAALEANKEQSKPVRHYIDYIKTTGSSIVLSMEGKELTIKSFWDDPKALVLTDSEGKKLSLAPTNVSPIYKVEDKRFKTITLRAAQDEASNNYLVIGTDGNEWPFRLTSDGVKYFSGMGTLMDLDKVEAVGFKTNQAFGSGRGYIWSRTIPMIRETIFLGHGADTYCAYFPQEDYVGKYNSGTFSSDINIVVDKPHNMYMGMAVGTGVLSLLAFLALLGIYLAQSIKLYWKEQYASFSSYVGVGIFLGICGFLVSGLVNDSTVSVMPMFYGLLGTGIAINMMLQRERTLSDNAKIE